MLGVLALTWFAAYLVWRVGWSHRGTDLWLWAALLVAELYGWWSLATALWIAWRIPPVHRPPATPGHTVDVFVCTYDEPLDVLRATLTGCAGLTYPHRTWLLDDGRREPMHALAREFGVGYLTREGNAHAKAGNINAALPRTEGELSLILDADHVPMPDALDAIVGYFDAPDVALVQTPHDFSNHDSIQHYEQGRHEQSVFYGVIQPGKDRHDAAFWCGSAGMIRREALEAVGGVAVETIAEDFHTTIKLHRDGWRSRYHDEVLVQGLAPHDLAAYLLQRDRWARGNLAVFTTPESPLRRNGLTPAQRLSYFVSLTAYLAGPARLLTLAVLVVVLWTGLLPLTADPAALAFLWLPATMLALAAGSALARGYQTAGDTTHYELLTAEIHLRALRCAVRPGRAEFRVTPKEGIDLGGLTALRQLRLLTAVGVLLAAGLVLRVLDGAGVVACPGALPGLAVWLVPLIAVVEVRRVGRTLWAVASRRQLRRAYRVPVEGLAALTADADAAHPMTARLLDLSPEGAGVVAPLPVPAGAAVTLTAVGLAGDHREPLRVHGVVARSQPRPDGTWRVGLRFDDPAAATRRQLITVCAIERPMDRLERRRGRGTRERGAAAA